MSEKEFRRRLAICFWCGYFLDMFGNLFIQDWLGLQGFLSLVNRHWVNRPWWVWVPLILLAALVYGESQNVNPEYFSDWFGRRDKDTPYVAGYDKEKSGPRKFLRGGVEWEGHSRD